MLPWNLSPQTCVLPPEPPVIVSVGLDLEQSAFAGLNFEEVVVENQSMVFSLALRFLRNRGVAEELAQDVFLQCHRQLDQIQSRAHAASWLRRAICHRAIDELCKQRFRASVAL